MSGIDWKNLNFSAKEVIAAITFVVTMSGVWYKMNGENDETAKTAIETQQMLLKHLQEEKDDRKELEARVKVLEKDKERRDAIEEYENNNVYKLKKQR